MSEVLWRASTTRHSWRDGAFLQQLFQRAEGLGLIGPVTWRKAGVSGKPAPVQLAGAAALLRDLPSPRKGEPPVSFVEAGGELPRPFRITLSLPLPPPPGEGALVPSMLWLYFDEELVAAPARARALADAFVAAHTPETTEYAFIHPFEHWKDFGDRGYRAPVTSGSTFKGVFWANFLGPGLLDEFDGDRLAQLLPPGDGAAPGWPEVRWIDRRGLSLIVAPTVAAAAAPAAEAGLVALSQRFRDALRPGSRWRRGAAG